MKQNIKLTVSALCAALAAVFTLTAYFPYITYAAPAVAGLVMIIPLTEIDWKWATASYLASVLPVMLLAENEAKLLYVFFFGWYPIAKALVERLKIRAAQWTVKLLLFNAAILLVYGVMSAVVNLSVEEFGVLGQYGIYIFWAAANVVFLLYDRAIIQVSFFYIYRIHPKVKRLFKL